ncbi:MAG: hypothetical protein ACREON_01910 [Gemmatimonadaceae bacterium]
MIGKQDILERAREWQLRPEVVEKDYALAMRLRPDMTILFENVALGRPGRRTT